MFTDSAIISDDWLRFSDVIDSLAVIGCENRCIKSLVAFRLLREIK